jgi:hypothetical protein
MVWVALAEWPAAGLLIGRAFSITPLRRLASPWKAGVIATGPGRIATGVGADAEFIQTVFFL